MAAVFWRNSVNDRKVKGSGLDGDLSTVPTGSCNCVCFLIRYSTIRCSAGRITTAINPQNMGHGYRAILRHLTIEKEIFFLSHTFEGPKLSSV
ncbi:hypothetical protein AVEN_76275-1 [Araneus ventricosus]|uniref:Uncharacterized protein n=1 Tax=Araneus ventricosus TaxID=182803 RepID=A0A4Y2T8K1_ARAVE|nr:hypothetical protein AVEN_76275-1 [Araneus ventricosus]